MASEGCWGSDSLLVFNNCKPSYREGATFINSLAHCGFAQRWMIPPENNQLLAAGWQVVTAISRPLFDHLLPHFILKFQLRSRYTIFLQLTPDLVQQRSGNDSRLRTTVHHSCHRNATNGDFKVYCRAMACACSLVVTAPTIETSSLLTPVAFVPAFALVSRQESLWVVSSQSSGLWEICTTPTPSRFSRGFLMLVFVAVTSKVGGTLKMLHVRGGCSAWHLVPGSGLLPGGGSSDLVALNRSSVSRQNCSCILFRCFSRIRVWS